MVVGVRVVWGVGCKLVYFWFEDIVIFISGIIYGYNFYGRCLVMCNLEVN